MRYAGGEVVGRYTRFETDRVMPSVDVYGIDSNGVWLL